LNRKAAAAAASSLYQLLRLMDSSDTLRRLRSAHPRAKAESPPRSIALHCLPIKSRTAPSRQKPGFPVFGVLSKENFMVAFHIVAR
jgi:hypothetical protein